ncbi:unnamed protein product [Musa textilis]
MTSDTYQNSTRIFQSSSHESCKEVLKHRRKNRFKHVIKFKSWIPMLAYFACIFMHDKKNKSIISCNEKYQYEKSTRIKRYHSWFIIILFSKIKMIILKQILSI